MYVSTRRGWEDWTRWVDIDLNIPLSLAVKFNLLLNLFLTNWPGSNICLNIRPWWKIPESKSFSAKADNDSGKSNHLDVGELKRIALENYSAFLESLDANSLENEMKNPNFERYTRNFIVGSNSDTLVEGTFLSNY